MSNDFSDKIQLHSTYINQMHEEVKTVQET